MRTIILLGLSFFFTSCMHLGMMGTGTDHQSNSEPVLEKEVTIGDTRATAIFPPLEIEKETLFTLKVMDKRTGNPVPGAEGSFHVQFRGTPGDHRMQRHADPANEQKMVEHDENLARQLSESSEKGIFTVSFKPSQAGNYQLMFHVTAVGGLTLEPELTIEATRIALMSHDSGAQGMHGSSSIGTYGLIAGITMGAMMIWFWASGRRVF